MRTAKLPETHKDFWKKKISDNIVRDRKNIGKLRGEGWNVIIIWLCEIKNKSDRAKRLERLIGEIINNIFRFG